jgi:hypothetical protein
MKNKIGLAIIAVILAGCGMGYNGMADLSAVKITKTENFPGLKKDVLFERARMWVAESAHSAPDIIKYENKENGILIIKGNLKFPRRQYAIVGFIYCALIIKLEDEKATCIVKNLYFEKYLQNSYGPTKDELPRIIKSFEDLICDLFEYLKNPTI